MKTACKLLMLCLLVIAFSNIAQAQTPDAPLTQPEKRWGIGITIGMPERAMSTNYNYDAPLNNGFYMDEGRKKHYNFAAGIQLNYKVRNRNSIMLRYAFNLNNTHGYRAIGPSPDIIRYDTIKGYQYIHSFYLGYELETSINKRFLLGITPCLLLNLYGKAHTTWKDDDNINNHFYYSELTPLKGGYGIGISVIPFIKYALSNSFTFGVSIPLSLTYVHLGNDYRLYTIDTKTNTVVQDEIHYAKSTYSTYFSFTPYFSVQYLF